MEIRAAELTADHLGRRIRFDYTNDDGTFDDRSPRHDPGISKSGDPPTRRLKPGWTSN